MKQKKRSRARRVNLPFLGCLLLASGISVAAVYLTHGYQIKRNADVLLQHADAARKNENWKKAIDNLERHLKVASNGNMERRLELGLLQADHGDVREAFATLEGVLREDPSKNEARRPLVDLLIKMGRTLDAKDHLEILLRKSPDDVDLIDLSARVHFALNDYSATAVALEKAFRLAPDHLEYAAQLAELLNNRIKDPARAFALLDAVVSANPQAAYAYVMRGKNQLDYHQIALSTNGPEAPGPSTPFLSREGLLDGALTDARQALKLAPDDEAVIGFAAACLMANNLSAEAGALAERGLTIYPKNRRLYCLRAGIDRRDGRTEAALAWYRRGLDALPDDQELLWNLTGVLIDLNQMDEVQNNLDHLRQLGEPPPRIAFLEARILIQQLRWNDASRHLERIRASLIPWPDLARESDYWLGHCYQRLLRIDQQYKAFRRAVSADPDWIPARLGLGEALAASGKLDEAIEQYQLVAMMENAPMTALEQLVRLHIARNYRRPTTAQDWKVASQLLDQLEGIQPEFTSLPILRSEVLLAQGDQQKARETLTLARDKSPKNLDYWLSLIALEERQEDAAEVETLLASARAEIGDTVSLRLALAQHYVTRQKADARESLHEMARTVDGLSNEQRLTLLSGLAELLLKIGDLQEAERLGNLVAAEQPTNLRTRQLLLELAIQSGENPRIEKALQELASLDESSPIWHYGEAIRLMMLAQSEKQSPRYDAAKIHLKAAREARPSWARVPLLLARIYDTQGEEDEAITWYSEALTLGDRGSATINRVLSLLYQRQRFSEADRLIRDLQLLESGPISPEMTKFAAEISLRLDDREGALKLVEEIDAASNNPEDHLWAGHILDSLGKTEEAEARFRQSLTLDDTSAVAWLALIQLYVRTERTQNAENAFAEAGSKIRTEDRALFFGPALELIGRFSEAEVQYQAALVANPDSMPVLRRLTDFYLRRRQLAVVEPLFHRLLATNSDANDKDRLWARRNLALIRMSIGSPAALNEALKLVEVNLSAAPASVPDRKMKAMLLASFPDRSSKLAAVTSLEQLLNEKLPETDPTITEARFGLVQLYRSLGDTGKGQDQLRELMVSQSDEPRYLTYYIQYLISQQNLVEAELWLDRFVKIAPKDFATLEFSTEIAFLKERYENVLPAVDKFLSESLEKQDPKSLELAQKTALLLEKLATQFKRSVASESPPAVSWADRFLQRGDELFRSDIKKRPAETLAMAAYLGRTDRPDQALDFLEQQLATAQPNQILSVTSAICYSVATMPEHFERSERLIQAALPAHGFDLAVALAQTQNWMGKYSEAEKWYRAALNYNSQDVVAMNDLAVLLALRGQPGNEPLNLIQKVIEIVGPYPVALDSRSTVYYMSGDFPQAADDIAHAISMAPGPTSYFRQALIAQRMGNRGLASTALRLAKHLHLQMPELHPLERPMFLKLQAELQ